MFSYFKGNKCSLQEIWKTKKHIIKRKIIYNFTYKI